MYQFVVRVQYVTFDYANAIFLVIFKVRCLTSETLVVINAMVCSKYRKCLENKYTIIYYLLYQLLINRIVGVTPDYATGH